MSVVLIGALVPLAPIGPDSYAIDWSRAAVYQHDGPWLTETNEEIIRQYGYQHSQLFVVVNNERHSALGLIPANPSDGPAYAELDTFGELIDISATTLKAVKQVEELC